MFAKILLQIDLSITRHSQYALINSSVITLQYCILYLYNLFHAYANIRFYSTIDVEFYIMFTKLSYLSIIVDLTTGLKGSYRESHRL